MVVIRATHQSGETEQGEPTTIETAQEIIRILSGRLGIVYEIHST
jgi:hypothetical protein